MCNFLTEKSHITLWKLTVSFVFDLSLKLLLFGEIFYAELVILNNNEE